MRRGIKRLRISQQEMGILSRAGITDSDSDSDSYSELDYESVKGTYVSAIQKMRQGTDRIPSLSIEETVIAIKDLTHIQAMVLVKFYDLGITAKDLKEIFSEKKDQSILVPLTCEENEETDSNFNSFFKALFTGQFSSMHPGEIDRESLPPRGVLMALKKCEDLDQITIFFNWYRLNLITSNNLEEFIHAPFIFTCFHCDAAEKMLVGTEKIKKLSIEATRAIIKDLTSDEAQAVSECYSRDLAITIEDIKKNNLRFWHMRLLKKMLTGSQKVPPLSIEEAIAKLQSFTEKQLRCFTQHPDFYTLGITVDQLEMIFPVDRSFREFHLSALVIMLSDPQNTLSVEAAVEAVKGLKYVQVEDLIKTGQPAENTMVAQAGMFAHSAHAARSASPDRSSIATQSSLSLSN
ncbi:MAG: hypothetical protein A3F12_07735 [Gammaproteobacteria bacterium RIFCSPHIGHO2_12_FULL_38_14]|nr:MAG: hypothetical protein A3F12_07735 [Gammaproteobacteria bacterium RIFCSPHIGHO2_12_FULL_38_14]